VSTPFWDVPDGSSNDAVRGIEGPLFLGNPYDTCQLGASQLPGLCKVTISSKKRRVQQKKSNGADGATPTFRGIEVAQGKIDVVCWTPGQFAEMDRLLPIIYPNPGKDINRLSALDISNPKTQHRGIRAIIVEDVAGPDDGPVKGSMVWSLKWVEYQPTSKKPAVKTPTGAVATTKAFQPAPKGANTPVLPSQSGAGKPAKNLVGG
jgi:hypothetical protein